MSLFIVEGYDWGYGESSYFLVQCNTELEAKIKVAAKLEQMTEKEKRKGDILPCEVKMDEHGVSQQLSNMW